MIEAHAMIINELDQGEDLLSVLWCRDLIDWESATPSQIPLIFGDVGC